MTGVKSGVAIKILADEPRALFTHCYGHALNLATQDTQDKGIKVMEDTLNTVHEITKLIKKSPKHQTISQKLKDDVAAGSSGIRIFCPTRWTVRAEALASIADNYNSLMQTWDAAKDATRDTEMKARIGGVTAQMESFDFIFGVELGQKLLNMVDNLSCSLQSTRHSACEGQRIVQTTKLIFQSIRSSGTTLKPEGFQLMCQIPPFHIVEMFHLVLKQVRLLRNIQLM